jgi:serine protease Do
MNKGSMRITKRFLVFTLTSLMVLLTACSSTVLPSTSPQASQSPIAKTVTAQPVVSTATPTVTPEDIDAVLPDVVSIVARVKPSVVAINDQVVSTSRRGATTQAAAGSGWIMDSNGLIVTNDHVISGAQNILVSLDDGRTFPAVKVSSDPVNDLAVIKVNATGLPAAKMGDSSSLQVGMQVIAMGNALGEGIRVTGGIVSNLGTSISLSATQTLYDLIETDAAINPGNSGGPLVNMAGEVVGIVNAKVSASGVEGMGYAISFNNAASILQQLATQGKVVQTWIGAVFQTVDPGVAFIYGLSVQQGVLILDVSAGSPASAAGLQQGDVITTISGKNVTTASQVAQVISNAQIGQKLQIVYQRGTGKSTVEVTTAQNPTL